MKDKSSLALIGEKASRLSLLLRRALVGGGHERRLPIAMLSKVCLPTSEQAAFQRTTASACSLSRLLVAVWGCVKGDGVRVHLLGLIVMDELCRVSRNRGVWIGKACSAGVYTAWRICNLWQREVWVGLRMQPAYVTVEA